MSAKNIRTATQDLVWKWDDCVHVEKRRNISLWPDVAVMDVLIKYNIEYITGIGRESDSLDNCLE